MLTDVIKQATVALNNSADVMRDAPTRIAELEAERDALRAERDALKVDAERVQDELVKLRNWANAYPLTVFPKPDLARAHELLQAGGMTLDSISADTMRHVLSGAKEIIDAAMNQPKEGQ